MAKQPTTTSYALLGLLMIRSWTAYDLTQQVRRALQWVWPRSDASLYVEVKRLDEMGLARATEEESGGRSRTRYEITDKGRAAVRVWLSDIAPTPPQIQFEQVLRVFLADLGDRDDLRRSLDTTRQQVAAMMQEIIPILEDYAGSDPPYPGRAHLNVLFIHFMAGHFSHILNWCDDVETELDTWSGTAEIGHTAGTRRMLDDALDLYRTTVDAIVERGTTRS